MLWWKRIRKIDKNEEAEFRKKVEAEGGVDKKDLHAMIISALITYVPLAIIILVGISVMAMAMFGVFG